MKQLFTFLIIISAHLLFSQSITPSSTREVFNFEVGDTFEYITGNNYSPQLTFFVSVTGKTAIGDTIFYSYQKDTIIRNIPPPNNPNNCLSPIDYPIAVKKVFDLDSPVFIFIKKHYRVYKTPSGLNEIDTTYIDNGKVNYWYAISMSDWREYYRDSLGIVSAADFYENSQECQGGYYLKLVYYHKKNGMKSGTPVYTGVGNVSENKIQVYPNPFFDKINISSELQKPKRIELYNIYGEKVFEETIFEKNSLDLTFLPSGIYFLTSDLGKAKILKL